MSMGGHYFGFYTSVLSGFEFNLYCLCAFTSTLKKHLKCEKDNKKKHYKIFKKKQFKNKLT